jgi:hypothetical protein
MSLLTTVKSSQIMQSIDFLTFWPKHRSGCKKASRADVVRLPLKRARNAADARLVSSKEPT